MARAGSAWRMNPRLEGVPPQSPPARAVDRDRCRVGPMRIACGACGGGPHPLTPSRPQWGTPPPEERGNPLRRMRQEQTRCPGSDIGGREAAQAAFSLDRPRRGISRRAALPRAARVAVPRPRRWALRPPGPPGAVSTASHPRLRHLPPCAPWPSLPRGGTGGAVRYGPRSAALGARAVPAAPAARRARPRAPSPPGSAGAGAAPPGEWC
jgi:hypothetical protein